MRNVLRYETCILGLSFPHLPAVLGNARGRHKKQRWIWRGFRRFRRCILGLTVAHLLASAVAAAAGDDDGLPRTLKALLIRFNCVHHLRRCCRGAFGRERRGTLSSCGTVCIQLGTKLINPGA